MYLVVLIFGKFPVIGESRDYFIVISGLFQIFVWLEYWKTLVVYNAPF